MRIPVKLCLHGIPLVILTMGHAALGADPIRVDVVPTPNGGIQPQAVVDAKGTIHLVYLKGNPSSSDIEYVRREAGSSDFSKPIRVNSEPGAAVAMGTIRGAQLALGRGGRVHVAWNGSRTSFKVEGPMLYSRLDPETGRFEPQRNLMTRTISLDGGGTIAADAAGHVYVAWHARAKGAPEGEINRRLWIARSNDDGATFGAEQPAIREETGACACCGTRALADAQGTLYVMYRAAREKGTERDLFLVRSRDAGDHFDGQSLQPWRINACPMSSASMADAPGGPVAAWETAGQIYFSPTSRPQALEAPPGAPGNRKHPSIAAAHDGSILLAWTEGTGWQKGGALAWQVFDPSGKPTEFKGRVERGTPVWGLPTAIAKPDGGFLVIH